MIKKLPFLLFLFCNTLSYSQSNEIKRTIYFPDTWSNVKNLNIYEAGDGHDYYIQQAHGTDGWIHYIECDKCGKFKNKKSNIKVSDKPNKIIKFPDSFRISAKKEMPVYTASDGHDYYPQLAHGNDGWFHYIECKKCKN